MAPKRPVKKAAPPPPPPAASSEDTESSSRSEGEESEDEVALAESPPAAPNNTPAPPHKGDEEEDESGESEVEPAHAAPSAAPTPKNQPPPPPQQRDDPETSDEEEEEGEGEEEPTRAAPPSAPKKQPPPQHTDEEEEEGESEEEEEDELAPKQASEGVKPPAMAETKKPAKFSRIWSTDDDIRILEALATHQKQHGTTLLDALAGKLDNRAYGSKELHGKVGTLKRRYHALSQRAKPPSKEHDRRVLELSKTIWGGDKSTAAAAPMKAAANDHKRKNFEEMCELFPYLAEEVKERMAEHPGIQGIFKRDFGKMDDEKARVIDEKIKRQRVAHMKVELRRHDLTREVTKAIIDLVN